MEPKPTLLTDADALDVQAKLHLKQVSIRRREWEEATAAAHHAKRVMQQAAKDATTLFDQANAKRRQHHRLTAPKDQSVRHHGPMTPRWLMFGVEPNFPVPPLAETARIQSLGFRAIGEPVYSRRRPTSSSPTTWRERLHAYFHPEEGSPRYWAQLRWRVRLYPLLALFDPNLRKWARANRATTV